jgi:predicted phosphodiesterase
MRSYTNKKGEVIEVSKEHLDTAVRIKQELQKASPSRRCSWEMHKKLMEKEGFFDSSTCEAYRCLIKDYQKSIGELPPAPTHAELVAESKLESLKELVGELAWEKRENQNILRQLNKTKREIIDDGLLISEVTLAVKNVLSTMSFDSIINHVFSPINNHSNTRMIAVISDWHIGALVDVEGNKYNYEIAVQRINDYAEQIVALATERKVYRIDVVYCGDMLEHAYMRNSQAYHAEFPVSEQMARGGRLMIELLLKLSKNFFVTYRGFAGNHDRLNGDKNGNIDGDTGMVVVNEMVRLFMETAGIDNLMYVDCKPYGASLIDVNGRNFKFVHGDLEKKSDTGKISDHSSRDKVIYDAIVYGHFHHYMVLEVGVDRLEIRCGSLKGSDDFSEKLGVGSAPSQVAIIVSEDGEIEAKRIRLR